eukprot:TRINITY_DN9657_c0_g2_i1.p1 TRINITY_DN9657_c0_g2~~TRINITY_DN9657_c0_g2_i1.p1  ORF type:complete len:100 (+),score=1.79 TRINITY_DN9657_c0_g2_i1:1006-1305(+)
MWMSLPPSYMLVGMIGGKFSTTWSTFNLSKFPILLAPPNLLVSKTPTESHKSGGVKNTSYQPSPVVIYVCRKNGEKRKYWGLVDRDLSYYLWGRPFKIL